MTDKKILHLGCGGLYQEGYINTDKTDTSPRGKKYKLDLILDISQPWPFEDSTIDGIVSMHVLQQVDWRGLVVALREAHRVLKRGGVMRFGCPMVEITDKPLEYLLGWNNINLFSYGLLKQVLVDRIGFSSFREHWYKRGAMPELYLLDNRHRRGTLYFEVIK